MKRMDTWKTRAAESPALVIHLSLLLLLSPILLLTSPELTGSALAGQKIAEVRASATLAKLGVPLERDPLGRIRWIRAAAGELNDEAMRHLSSLPLLEWVEIGGGGVTPAGMMHLGECEALRRLYIHDVPLKGDALGWLSQLRLEALSLQRTGIAGSVLRQLKASGDLTVLNLSGNGITDGDIVEVSRFQNLEVLALQDTEVTGAGLALLENMVKLNVLNLVNCRINDADLEHFEAMPNLRIVRAAGCSISDAAVKELGEKLPLLSIFR